MNTHFGYNHQKQALVRWQSPSNIALVKYWGKKGVQLPANPSLSMTLSESYTDTSVLFDYPSSGNPVFEFTFDGQAQPSFSKKIKAYLDVLADEFPFLRDLSLKINSFNTFPHSAGIASSASAMSALALCLCETEKMITSGKTVAADFYRRASHIARLGSGSAARSLYGRFVSWGETGLISQASDKYASPLQMKIHPVFNNFKDSILIVSSGEKKVSSRAGHGLMQGHPFASARYEQAVKNLELLLNALKSGDLELFVEVVENEALTLHAMMMSSRPGYTLFHPNSLELIGRVRAFRKQSRIPLCFTLDAGPNLHLLYPAKNHHQVRPFIFEELRSYCHKGEVIFDQMGEGPKKIPENE